MFGLLVNPNDQQTAYLNRALICDVEDCIYLKKKGSKTRLIIIGKYSLSSSFKKSWKVFFDILISYEGIVSSYIVLTYFLMIFIFNENSWRKLFQRYHLVYYRWLYLKTHEEEQKVVLYLKQIYIRKKKYGVYFLFTTQRHKESENHFGLIWKGFFSQCAKLILILTLIINLMH